MQLAYYYYYYYYWRRQLGLFKNDLVKPLLPVTGYY
jgi:hypothetical protein